jgi:hypothetical protein
MCDLLDRFTHEQYVVTVNGHVDLRTMPPLPEINVQIENGTSIISGITDNPATLHDLLDVLHKQDKSLVSVQRQKPKLEDIFVQLTDHETQPTRLPC